MTLLKKPYSRSMHLFHCVKLNPNHSIRCVLSVHDCLRIELASDIPLVLFFQILAVRSRLCCQVE